MLKMKLCLVSAQVYRIVGPMADHAAEGLEQPLHGIAQTGVRMA